MFSKKELEILDKIVPTQKFLESDQGLRAAQQGYEDAIRQESRY